MPAEGLTSTMEYPTLRLKQPVARYNLGAVPFDRLTIVRIPPDTDYIFGFEP